MDKLNYIVKIKNYGQIMKNKKLLLKLLIVMIHNL